MKIRLFYFNKLNQIENKTILFQQIKNKQKKGKSQARTIFKKGRSSPVVTYHLYVAAGNTFLFYFIFIIFSKNINNKKTE